MTNPIPKTRKKKNSRDYFTKDHENGIVQYARTDDRDETQKLYIELLQPAFNELGNKIVYTYKFSTLPNIDVHMEEGKMWLTTILDK